jgi:hypothetical protein
VKPKQRVDSHPKGDDGQKVPTSKLGSNSTIVKEEIPLMIFETPGISIRDPDSSI